MKQTCFLVVLFFAVIFSSCYKQLEIEFPENEPLIAVSCLFTKDRSFIVNVNKTIGFNDSVSHKITNATCKLYANNQFIENLTHSSDGFYTSPSNYKPDYNTVYKIEISSEDLPVVSATNQLPTPVQIINLTKQDSVMFGEDGKYLHQLDITIDDPAEINNYYEFTIIAYYKLDYSEVWWLDSTELAEVDTSYRTRTRVPQSQDIVLKNEGLLDYYPRTFPFSDELFNGQTYTLNINYLLPSSSAGWDDTEINLITDYQLIVAVRSVSEDYYKYKKKLIIHQENQNSDIWNGIGEPVQMFSNIKNGYGIFAGYTTFIDTIQ